MSKTLSPQPSLQSGEKTGALSRIFGRHRKNKIFIVNINLRKINGVFLREFLRKKHAAAKKEEPLPSPDFSNLAVVHNGWQTVEAPSGKPSKYFESLGPIGDGHKRKIFESLGPIEEDWDNYVGHDLRDK